ncbi:MAG: oligosaccharide flippase family protein [Lachnospiraceae bacterium]
MVKTMNPSSKVQKIIYKTKNNLVIKGTLILIITGLLTRILGFYNRIFLSDLIGAKELGIYQLIFPLYMVVFSFSVYGNELALTKLVAQYEHKKTSTNIFFYICFFHCLFCSIACSYVLYTYSHWISLHILNAPECDKCLQIISLGIPFMAMKGSIHGYFLGRKISVVHGLSDLIEQFTKIFSLYIISCFICIKTQYPASFAVWGIVFGEIISFLYSFICFINYQRKHKSPETNPKQNKNHILKAITIFNKQAIPMTTNRCSITMVQSIESILIPTVLLSYYHDSTICLSVYGILTGISFPFIMFPSTITNALSTMLMPAVSSASGENDRTYLKILVENSIHFCLLIGLFSGLVFYIFGKDIGLLLFQNKESGIYLYQLSLLCPFIYLSTNMASILNGLGFATINLIQTLCASFIRIMFIIICIPKIGIMGYVLGLFVSYLFLTYACLFRLSKYIDFKIHFINSIFKPACVFIITGSFLFYIYKKSITAFTLTGMHTVILLILILFIYCLFTICPMILSTYRGLQRHR